MSKREGEPTWMSGQLEEQKQKGLAGWHVNAPSKRPAVPTFHLSLCVCLAGLASDAPSRLVR